jgi:hypothetical protein
MYIRLWPAGGLVMLREKRVKGWRLSVALVHIACRMGSLYVKGCGKSNCPCAWLHTMVETAFRCSQEFLGIITTVHTNGRTVIRLLDSRWCRFFRLHRPDLEEVLSHGSWRRGRIEGLLRQAFGKLPQDSLAYGSLAIESLTEEA